jgi:predicted nucleotide-binding protein (sugar kinase/HSP70/actin superfamily)
MIRTARSDSFDPEHSAFFMPSGTGPCRFGQYNLFHKAVLDSIGPHDIPVIAPNQDDGLYQHLGEIGKDFTLNAWQGIIAIELLYKSLRETRPYALDKDKAQAVYDSNLKRVYNVLRGANSNGNAAMTLEDALVRARDEFSSIEVDRARKLPLVGIIGEIYVRLNEFSNENLVRKIEDMGGEVWMAPFEEWVYYINFVGSRKALRKREYSAILEGLVKHYYQEKTEHRLGHIFEGSLSRLHEARVKEVLRNAAPYVDDSFEGEAVLSVGKAIDMVEKGASGIVNAMPFGCMPSTVVTAIMRAVQRDYGAPWITIPYDGTESSTTELQLEAFMDQARSRMHRIKTTA